MRFLKITRPGTIGAGVVLLAIVFNILNLLLTAWITQWGLHEVFGLNLSFKDSVILAFVLYILTDHS